MSLKKGYFSRTYITGTLIGYTLQKIERACVALSYASGMRWFSRIVFSGLNLYRTGNIFGKLSMKEDDYAAQSQTNDLAEVTCRFSEKG